MPEDRQWKPIDTAPPNRWLEVRGTHGMSVAGGRPAAFLCVAQKMVNYRPLDPWRDLQNDALSDVGWVPTHWREVEQSLFEPASVGPEYTGAVTLTMSSVERVAGREAESWPLAGGNPLARFVQRLYEDVCVGPKENAV